MHSKIVFVKFQLICRRQNEGFLQKGQVQFLSMYTDMKPVTPHARTLCYSVCIFFRLLVKNRKESLAA